MTRDGRWWQDDDGGRYSAIYVYISIYTGGIGRRNARERLERAVKERGRSFVAMVMSDPVQRIADAVSSH